MTTVNRYRTPYLIDNTSTLIISFSLGNNVSLCIILGIPCLLAMDDVVNLVKDQLVCSELNQVFMLQLNPLDNGLLDSATYDVATMHGSVPSNILSVYSPIQYTSCDGTINPVSQNIHSRNLVVTDNYF